MARTGTPAQQFKDTHEKFIYFWAQGLHPLEIGHKLGLSANRLSKHMLKAFSDHAPRVEPNYQCLPWADLPEILKKALPSTCDDALVKVEVEAGGVILTVLLEDTEESASTASA